jgi:C_GCAxxG_C_C family probable redox protein
MKRRQMLKTCVAAATAAGITSTLTPTARADRKTFAPIDSKKMVATALECFTTRGQTCPESILSAGCQALGIESDLVPDIALGLAGGVGLQGRICGLLTASAMVVSLAVAKKEKDYPKKKLQSLQITGRLFNKFAQQFGSCRCRLLCGLDLTTPEGREKLEKEVKLQVCTRYVRQATESLARELMTLKSL